MNKPSGKKLPFSSKFLYKKFQYKIAFFPVNLHLKNPVKYYFISGIINKQIQAELVKTQYKILFNL